MSTITRPHTYASTNLVRATNEIFFHARVGDVTRALRIGCDILSPLANDADYQAMVESMQAVTSEHEAQVHEIMDSLEYYSSVFMKIEEDILRAGGLDDHVIDSLLLEVAKLRLSIDASAELGTVSTTLKSLREITCKIAQDLESQARTASGWRSVARIAIVVGLGVGGATVIALNAGSIISGLPAPFGATSASFGGVLISKSLDAILVLSDIDPLLSTAPT